MFIFSPVRNLSLKLSKEVDQGEARCPRVSQLANSPSVEWPFADLEEGGGLESLPFRLMMQDCTAVKTLLLKMKRVLQEVMVQSFVRLIVPNANRLCSEEGFRKMLIDTELSLFFCVQKVLKIWKELLHGFPAWLLYVPISQGALQIPPHVLNGLDVR